ncbi:MAG: NADPH-dependent FMN reductase [Actinomycetota bacterium]
MTISTESVLTIAAVCGSLRSGSFNAGLIQALEEVAEGREGLVLTRVTGLADLPPVDVDLLNNGVPDSVTHVQEQISSADAVILATPEYCYSMSSAAKTFFDWLALPNPLVTPLRHKPFGVLGASIGAMGTYRAQADARKAALFHDAELLGKPEVYVSFAEDKFDENGRLTDRDTYQLLEHYLDYFEEFARATRARDLASYAREFRFS